MILTSAGGAPFAILDFASGNEMTGAGTEGYSTYLVEGQVGSSNTPWSVFNTVSSVDPNGSAVILSHVYRTANGARRRLIIQFSAQVVKGRALVEVK